MIDFTKHRYNDPGQFMMATNSYGRQERFSADQGKTLYLSGMGASPEGNRPFRDSYDLGTKTAKRFWRSEAPFFEMPVAMMDASKGLF
ncbi:MAG: hypothetical protein IPJ00_21735 [Saprospirales bacterium]|nr:hypothetical protein [Saprospirales bacterium]